MPGLVQTDAAVRAEIHTALNAQSIGGLTFRKTTHPLKPLSATRQAAGSGMYRLAMSGRNNGGAHEATYSSTIGVNWLWQFRLEVVAAVCADVTQLDAEIDSVIAGFGTQLLKQFGGAQSQGRIFRWVSYSEPRLVESEASLWTCEIITTLDGWRSHSTA